MSFGSVFPSHVRGLHDMDDAFSSCMNRMGTIRTVLDAVCTPLVLHDVCEHGYTVAEQLINDTIFSLSFQVLECMLKDLEETLACNALKDGEEE